MKKKHFSSTSPVSVLSVTLIYYLIAKMEEISIIAYHNDVITDKEDSPVDAIRSSQKEHVHFCEFLLFMCFRAFMYSEENKPKRMQ